MLQRRALGEKALVLLLMGGTAVLSPTPAAATDFHNPEQLVEAMERRWAAVSGYRCQLHTVSVAGPLKDERVMEYAFERPRTIRMRILRGKDQGSTLVYRDGVVRGHRGGLLSWITLTFAPSDPAVMTIRGGRIDQSDFPFILEALRHAAADGALRWDGTVSLHGVARYRLDLVQHVEPFEAAAVAGTFWIDPGDLAVSQYELYDRDHQLIYRQVHDQLHVEG